jgi:hypothetical protein
MAQGDIIRKLTIEDLIRSSPVKRTTGVSAALLAALNDCDCHRCLFGDGCPTANKEA